jgi:GNAT superfamily N-acetyltransferase
VSEPVITVEPLTPGRWPDLETVFGPIGGVDGCWCMWFRQTANQYREGRGATNKAAFREIVERGDVPGLLAYVDGEPAAWCAIQPRDAYPRLDRSRITKSPDGAETWAAVCFVTRKEFRGQGLTARLLDAAVEHARANDAALIEGFPVEANKRVDAGTGFHGFASTFAGCGFKEVERRSTTLPYMRRRID